MKIHHIKIACLTVIASIGLFFRFYNFPNIPELHVDEMSFGYSAYAWLKTGVDEYGRAPGLVLESLGDWKLSLYAYFVFPFVALGGLNEWSVRFPAAIFGLLSIPLMYVLTKRLFKDLRLAVISALGLMMLPWHMVFSRTANEVTMELFFLMLGVWLYLVWLEKNSIRYLGGSTVAFALALISYYPAFVTVPLIAAYLPLLRLKIMNYKSYAWWKNLVVASVPLLVCTSLLAVFLMTQPKDRITATSFWGHESIAAEVSERITHSGLSATSIWWTRIFNNKYVVSFNNFINNYLAHFDLRYLFSEGELLHSRYDIPYQGPLYLWMAPFLIIGLMSVGRKILYERNYRVILVIFWVAVAMIPGAMTYEKANLQRSFLAIPGLIWLVAMGVVSTWEMLTEVRKRWQVVSLGTFVVTCVVFLAVFYNNYFVHGPLYMTWFRHAYVKELLEKVDLHRGKLERIYISDMPYLQMFFYDTVDPRTAQSLIAKQGVKHKDFNNITEYDGMRLLPKDCPKNGNPKYLYVCRGDVVSKRAYVLDVVRFADQVPAYVLVQFLPANDPRLLEDKGFRVVTK